MRHARHIVLVGPMGPASRTSATCSRCGWNALRGRRCRHPRPRPAAPSTPCSTAKAKPASARASAGAGRSAGRRTRGHRHRWRCGAGRGELRGDSAAAPWCTWPCSPPCNPRPPVRRSTPPPVVARCRSLARAWPRCRRSSQNRLLPRGRRPRVRHQQPVAGGRLRDALAARLATREDLPCMSAISSTSRSAVPHRIASPSAPAC